MADQTIDSTKLTANAMAQSPFLPGTKIQFAWVKEKADWLVANGIRQGECLISHLALNAKGYIPISFGRAVKQRAHRVVFFAAKPHIDQSLMVLHTCDNRACIELDHLFDGTAKDNTDDMILKGRAAFVQPRKDHIHRVKILELHAQGLNRFEIAAKLYISAVTVWNYISPKGPYYGRSDD